MIMADELLAAAAERQAERIDEALLFEACASLLNQGRGREAAMTPLPVVPAHRLAERAEEQRWLVADLWSEQAVGIIGGEPKCCKSFLALDLAVAVAAGRPCLRRFAAAQPRACAALRRRGRPAHRPSAPRRHLRRRLRRTGRHRRSGHHRAQPAARSASRSGQTRPDYRQLEARMLIPRSVRPPPPHRRKCQRRSRPAARLLARLQRRHRLAVVLVHHARKGAVRHARRTSAPRFLRVPRLGRFQSLSASRRR